MESAGLDYRGMPEMLAHLKIRAATDTLSSELRRLCRSIVAAAGADDPLLPEAVAALLSHIEVYRSDYPGLAAILPAALAETEAAATELGPALQVIVAALARGGEPATRLQQLCGAVTAKAVEDCIFYRDARLVSLNEVGGEPHRFGVGAAEFHHSAATRGRLWPQTMTALTTHDTKRGEDVRARIGVLSQVPSLWTEFISRWETHAPSPDRATGLFLWQNIFGVWPVSGEITGALRDRLHAYAEKAIREAAWHTSWNDQDAEFESAVHRWLDTVLDGPVAGELTKLVAKLNPHAASDALGQKLLALTAPGIPDIYQGTELWDDSLVDPDNRRPVDYSARRAALQELQHPKIRVVTAALRLRRSRPDCFLDGAYRPVLARGESRRPCGGVLPRRRHPGRGEPVDRTTGRKGLGQYRAAVTRRLLDRPAQRRDGQRTDVGGRIVRGSARRPAGARSWLNSGCGPQNPTWCASTSRALCIR